MQGHMKKWLALSVLLHLAVFLLVWLGLPHIPRRFPEPMRIVPVDIAGTPDITAAKKTKPRKAAPAPPKPKPPKPPEPKKPKPAKPPPSPKPKPPEPKPQPKTEKADAAIPKPKAKPKKKPPKPRPPQRDALASILKNVAKMKPPPSPPDAEGPPKKEPPPATAAPQVPAMAERLSVSEEDALRRQLAQCWNVPIGARDVENTVVEIYASINPDRTIREAVVVDQARMGRDPFFRTIAESALRALYNPLCSPLALPPEKYDEWRDTLMTFNPRDMF